MLRVTEHLRVCEDMKNLITKIFGTKHELSLIHISEPTRPY